MRRLALLLPLVLLLAAPAQGGRLFDDSASDGATFPDDAGGDDDVWSVHVQFKIDDGANVGTLFANCNSGSETNFMQLYVNGVAGPGDVLRFHANDTVGDGLATATSQWTAGTWTSGQGVTHGTDSRSVWLAGGSFHNDATAGIDPIGLDTASIGFKDDLAPDSHLSGTIGQIAIYSDALSDAEMVSLAKGAWPAYVSSATLAQLFQMTGQRANITDVVGGNAYTTSGTAKAGHKNLCPWPGMQQ